MARKIDLFALLAEKQREFFANAGTTVQKPARPAARGRNGSPAGWLAACRQWWTDLGNPASTARAQRTGFHVSGLALSAIVFAGIGFGFVLGKVLTRPALAGEGSALRTEDPRLRPNWIVESDDQVLANDYLPVVGFAASERDAAGRLAAYLREQGVATARVRKLELRGTPIWATVVYLLSGPGEVVGCVDMLARIKVPEFAPRFAENVKTMRQEPARYLSHVR